MAKQKRILFITYFYPPFKGIASIRTGNIALYLSELGWDVTVVKPDPGLWESPQLTTTYNKILHSGIKHVYTGHQLKFLSPFIPGSDRKLYWLGIGWEISTKALLTRICQDHYDVVLASGPPFSTFRLAEIVANKNNIPLVLDYRDLWTRGNPFRIKRPKDSVEYISEKRIVNEAALLITVSRGLKSCLIENFNIGSKIHILENGYNPNELGSINPMDFGHPAIVYAGELYPPKRSLSPIFAALKIIIDHKYDVPDNWRFHYFGASSQLVKAEASAFNLMDRVIIHDFVPREQALSANKGSVVSVVITTISANLVEEEKGVVTGKIYDLIGLGSRILLVTPHGSDAEALVRETGLGESYNGEEINKIAEYICRCFNEKKPESFAVDHYSWPKLSSRLDVILSTLLH
jgi:glycosyltransferase involved in cell wall biosynthesis